MASLDFADEKGRSGFSKSAPVCQRFAGSGARARVCTRVCGVRACMHVCARARPCAGAEKRVARGRGTGLQSCHLEAPACSVYNARLPPRARRSPSCSAPGSAQCGAGKASRPHAGAQLRGRSLLARSGRGPAREGGEAPPGLLLFSSGVFVTGLLFFSSLPWVRPRVCSLNARAACRVGCFAECACKLGASPFAAESKKVAFDLGRTSLLNLGICCFVVVCFVFCFVLLRHRRSSERRTSMVHSASQSWHPRRPGPCLPVSFLV